MPDAALLIPPEQNFFVADAPEHVPQSNKDVLLGDAERDSEVTAALLPLPYTPFRRLFRLAHPQSDRARQAEAWGCSGPDGAELCANLENLFKLD